MDNHIGRPARQAWQLCNLVIMIAGMNLLAHVSSYYDKELCFYVFGLILAINILIVKEYFNLG